MPQESLWNEPIRVRITMTPTIDREVWACLIEHQNIWTDEVMLYQGQFARSTTDLVDMLQKQVESAAKATWLPAQP